MKKSQIIHVGVFLRFAFILHAQDPAITNQPASRALWTGGTVMFSVGVSGTGPFTYQWLFNGTNLPLNKTIYAVAGTGRSGYSGDGGAATNARLNTPYFTTISRLGSLFIADTLNRRVRMVNTQGVITTIAGNGTSSPLGDGGPATNASLQAPSGVALDSFGNLFIADSSLNRIRKVDTNGIIWTVAGNGTNGYSGDGGAATNASLGAIRVFVDKLGELFLSEPLNAVVRKVDTNGIIWTVAGNGSVGYSGDGGMATNAQLTAPADVAMDNFGNLFIADRGTNCVRRVDTNGIITTVAGNGNYGFFGDGGPATNATFKSCYGVTVDNMGEILIADYNNNRIREVDTNGIVWTVAGGGTNSASVGFAATNAAFNTPDGVALDIMGNIFITTGILGNQVFKVGPPANLVLSNVTSTNAGSYQVVVTGANGSVTSSVVNLVVASSPLIYQTSLNPDSSVSLAFVSQPGTTNVVLCATNLAPPVVWQTIATNLAGPDGTWQFTDNNAAGNQSLFYRSLTQ